MTKREAGRIGGLATLRRYGTQGMAARGKLGGRPRSPTIDEIRQQQSLKAQTIDKGGQDTPGDLRELKRLWKSAARSRPGSIPNAEGPVTPSPAPGGDNHG